MDTVSFSIPGKVLTARRPKFNSRQKRAYNSQGQELLNLKKQIHAQLPTGWQPYQNEIWVDIEAIFRRPKAMLRKKYVEQPYIKTPDSDNIVKIYLDAMNGIVYEDDRLVVKLLVCKRYTRPNESNSPVVNILVLFPNGG